MSLEELARQIVANNQSERKKAASRLNRLIDITAAGTADDLKNFTEQLIAELERQGNQSDGEEPEVATVGGNAGG